MVLLGPAALHLRTVAPLFHPSEMYSGVSRALIVGLPLLVLTTLNLLVAGISRSLRVTLAAAIVTTLLALLIVFGALGVLEILTAGIGPND
jgi:hypothetical protein